MRVRALVAVALAAVLSACPRAPDPEPQDAGLVPCVDRPTNAQNAGKQLPCEMLPPGFNK